MKMIFVVAFKPQSLVWSLCVLPKMYYYALPTLRSLPDITTLVDWALLLLLLPYQRKTTALALKMTPCNRWKILLFLMYLYFIMFCFIWHHDKLQTSATASKEFRISPKSCILCVRNLLIVKITRAWKIERVVPHKTGKIVLSVPYTFKFMLCLLWLDEIVLQISVTNSQNWKDANYFSDGVVILGHTAW